MAGLYIHIPFCESRCIYCGFYSTTSLHLRDTYIDALCKEMELRPLASALGSHEPITTIYLGGGTPSQLSSSQLFRLFDGIKKYIRSEGRRAKSEETTFDGRSESQFNGNDKKENIFEGMEITMECNPDDVSEEFCKTLQQLPVNRVSMGAQTFSDDRLRFLHRRHNAAEVGIAVKRLRAVGIRNISIDLMFGFPGETLADWQSDIKQAASLGAEHISAYSLMYEEGTALHRMLESEKIQEIDEETSRQMYETLIDQLTQAGYEHYEISNFARPGYRSRHNSSYWQEVPYVGLGAAAHSYRRIVSGESSSATNGQKKSSLVERSWNVQSTVKYMEKIHHGQLPSENEVLDINSRFNDLITTALRTSDGINLTKMKAEFGETLYLHLLKEAQRHISLKNMKITDNHLSLTRQGLYISDDIMSDFMIV